MSADKMFENFGFMKIQDNEVVCVYANGGITITIFWDGSVRYNVRGGNREIPSSFNTAINKKIAEKWAR